MAARLITVAVAAALAGIFSLPSQPEPPKNVELTMASVSTATPFQLGGFDIISRKTIDRMEDVSLVPLTSPGIPKSVPGVNPPDSLFSGFLRGIAGPDSIIRSLLFSRFQRPELSLSNQNRSKKTTSSRLTRNTVNANVPIEIISFPNPLLGLRIFGSSEPSQNVPGDSTVIIIKFRKDIIDPKDIRSTAVYCGGALKAVEEELVVQFVVDSKGQPCYVILQVKGRTDGDQAGVDRVITVPVPPFKKYHQT